MVFQENPRKRWRWLPLALCLLLFVFSLEAKLELYGHGLKTRVHPCNSSKLCRDAHRPQLAAGRLVVARLATLPMRRPTLRSKPLLEDTFLTPVPRELNLNYESRLFRSPPRA